MTSLHWDGETFEEDVEWELKCIRKAGIRRVVVVDLTKPEFGLPVVRVIVPGLEPILGPGYIPGRRARAVLKEERERLRIHGSHDFCVRGKS